jgi:hypothetical protein
MENGKPKEKKKKCSYTPNTPNVHGRAVTGASKQKLWWPIPKRNDTVRVGTLLIFGIVSGKTEIDELQFSLVVQEQVGACGNHRMHIAVRLCVQEGNNTEARGHSTNP